MCKFGVIYVGNRVAGGLPLARLGATAYSALT
jgi:hypothetical protein